LSLTLTWRCSLEHVQAHYILDEMMMNGCIVETNKQNILQPIQMMAQAMSGKT